MSFKAILLICAMPVDPEVCTEQSALDVMTTLVQSELGCTVGWQETIARGSLREGIGERFYIKTVCNRVPESRVAHRWPNRHLFGNKLLPDYSVSRTQN